MNSFGDLLKRTRKQAGLSQQQVADKMDVSKNAIQNWESGATKVDPSRFRLLAYIYNIPVDTLFKAMYAEDDANRPNRWPKFLFDKETNDIISSLHLNLNQQDLFGLLYIYNAEYLKNTTVEFDTFYDDLKVVPYEFIGKVGSIQFMNMADALHSVLKYVKSDFLLKVIKQNPEEEFDICRMSKEQICEFIDEGYKPAEDYTDDDDCEGHKYEGGNALYFRISMKKARIILPVLEKEPIHITDGKWGNEPRRDVPPELIEMCGFRYELWKEEYYKSEYNPAWIRNGIEPITDYKAVPVDGGEDQWILSINEKGRSLLDWFREKE